MAASVSLATAYKHGSLLSCGEKWQQPMDNSCVWKKELKRSTLKVKKEARRSISSSQKGASEVDLLKKGKEPKRLTS